MIANRLSIHSYCFIPAWSTDAGYRAVEKAAAAGFDYLVVPTANQATIDPAAIAKMFEAAGLRPLVTATQRPEANISSTDPTIWAAGVERHRTSLRLARDMGSHHV